MSDLRRGVYILPNLLTTLSLCCGFYALITGIKIALAGGENFERCAIAILMAAIFDGMDGRVARMTKTSSKFGVEYDSLSDLVSFGVAPSVVIYLWGLRNFGRVGWLAAFLYIACGALRLARFNIQASGVEKRFFQGLPIPMAAMMMVGTILIWEGGLSKKDDFFFSGDIQLFLVVLTYLLAGLMVSSIPYRSFKTLHLTQRHPFYMLVSIVVGVMIFLTKPWWILFLIGCGYVLSGPLEKYLLAHPVRVYNRARQKRRMRRALDRMDELTTQTPADPTAPDNVHTFKRT